MAGMASVHPSQRRLRLAGEPWLLPLLLLCMLAGGGGWLFPTVLSWGHLGEIFIQQLRTSQGQNSLYPQAGVSVTVAIAAWLHVSSI